MGSIFVYPGMKLTEDELAELDELDNIPDEEIDYSDIPKTTDEEFKRMRRAKDFFETREVAN